MEIRIDTLTTCGKVPEMSENLPEPWLRGPIPGVHPLVMPVFFTFAQVREELSKHTAGLTDAQIWIKPANTTASLGFHLKNTLRVASIV